MVTRELAVADVAGETKDLVGALIADSTITGPRVACAVAAEPASALTSPRPRNHTVRRMQCCMVSSRVRLCGSLSFLDGPEALITRPENQMIRNGHRLGQLHGISGPSSRSHDVGGRWVGGGMGSVLMFKELGSDETANDHAKGPGEQPEG